MLFKIKDPADRDRVKQFILQQYGFVPDGLTFVPRQDRHQIDPRLVAQAMSQMDDILQNSSSSFVPERTGSEEVQKTAKQTMIELNQASALVSAMLNAMYLQEAFFYYEIVRRFCNKNSGDPEVKEFREKCIADGIPEEMLDVKKWKVSPERVLGGGDKSLAQQESAWLMQNRTAYDPKSQQTILRMATASFLDDYSKATMLVPITPVTATNGTYAAENVFGTLMSGNQVSLRTGIDQQGYIEALLKMLATVVQRVTQMDNTGTPGDLIGMVTVVQNIGQHLMILAEDQTQKAKVKQYGDALGKITNLIKGFGQRQAQAKAKTQPNPQDAAKAQSTIMKAQIGAQIKQQQAVQKERQKAIEFELDQARENMLLLAEIKREDISHRHELMNQSIERALDAIRQASMAEKGSED